MAADLVLRGYAGEIIISSANELEHDYINMAKGTTVAVKKKLLQRVLKNVREKRTSATKEKLIAVWVHEVLFVQSRVQSDRIVSGQGTGTYWNPDYTKCF